MKRMDECPDPEDGAFAVGTHRRSGSRELGSPEPSLWDSDAKADWSPNAKGRDDALPIEERHTAPSRRGAPRPNIANADEPSNPPPSRPARASGIPMPGDAELTSRAASRRARRNAAAASVSPGPVTSAGSPNESDGAADDSAKGSALRRARLNSAPPGAVASSASSDSASSPQLAASEGATSGSVLRRARLNSSPPPSLVSVDAARAAPVASGDATMRVVAKIIDPSVRDDGRGDPQFSLEPARDRVHRQPRVVGAPHPVRDRLLARARAALDVVADPEASVRQRAGAPGADDEWFPSGSPSRAEHDKPLEAAPDLADDLDLIGAPERPRPERTRHVAPALPAPTALLLGTLAGLAAIALLFAGLMRFVPHAALRTHELPTGVVAEAPPAAPDVPAPAPVGKVQRPPRTKVPGPWRIATAPPDARLALKQGSMGSHTFLAATQAAGVALKEAYRVLTAFEGIKNLDRCRPKDTFSALVDAQSGRLAAFEYTVNEEEVFQAREGADGKLAARKLDLDVKRHRAQGVVVLDGSFEASAQRAGFEPGLDTFVNKALSGYASTSDFKPGDVLGLVVQEVTVLGGFARYAGVEALEYRPVSGEPLRIYYQELDKSRGYVDSKGRVFGKSRWTRPVPGAGVTSRYNPKRMHPILKRIKPHNGTDFGAPIGTPVVAAAAGKVSFVGRAGPNGNMITIAHDGGFQTGYSHLSRFMKGLKVGARVEQKQPIGFVGSTGRSTGPHLHFSAKKNGRFIDPESLNLDGLLRLTVDQRLSSDLRRRYDRMLDALELPTPQAPVLAGTEPASADLGAPPPEIEFGAPSAGATAPAASSATPPSPVATSTGPAATTPTR